MLGKPLRDYQQKAVQNIFGEWNRGIRRTMLVVPTGCHACGQGIRMFDGTVKAVEDIIVGDVLMGPYLAPRRVLELHRGVDIMFDIVPEFGERWRVNGGHILSFKMHGSDRYIDQSVVSYFRRNTLHENQRSSGRGDCLIRVGKNGEDRIPFRIESTDTFEKYFGFTVDGDHRYLLADMTVSHNSGKTVIASEVARLIQDLSQLTISHPKDENLESLILNQGQKMIWLCHREELAYQAQRALREATGRIVDLEMGDFRAAHRDAPIVVAMVQSIQGQRRRRYGPDRFQVGVIDEAHHATAKTYMATIDYFTGINRWLGLTATPKRSDGVALGKVFESVAYHMEVSTAVDLGWLVAPKQRIASCRDIDLRNVDTVAGDFHKAQLKAQLMKQQVVDQIARKSIAVADGRQTIVFCQTVDQAHALSRVFTLLGEKSVSICGKTPSGIRKDRVDRFRSGSARFLCQVNICTEGFDVPECEVVSMARPTKSQPVFAQAVGRGLRPLNPPQGLTPSERRKEIQASTKPHATVLDFYGNTGRHKLCNTGDLLGGEYDDEVRAMAVRKAQEIDQDIDMIALLESCKEEIARLPQAARAGSSQETEQDKLYKLFAHALMRYEPHPCDALGIDPKLPQAAVDKEDTYGGSMSRSVKCCENHRLTATEIGKMSQYQVVYVARVLEDRESRGLCTYPQLRFLYKHGYPPNLTIPQASQKIARIKANKGRRPSEDGPNEILRRLVDRLSVPRR